MKNKITTNSELYDLVELDTTSNKIKQIAELFLTAMNDWPTYNQSEITDFIKEVKEYFGSPLTIEKIDAKNRNEIDEVNFWRIESGSSIAEMIEFSKLYFNETDFDRIVSDILSYYSKKEINKP
jgi:thiol-disulfide isomerase/thioredoxin